MKISFIFLIFEEIFQKIYGYSYDTILIKFIYSIENYAVVSMLKWFLLYNFLKSTYFKVTIHNLFNLLLNIYYRFF